MGGLTLNAPSAAAVGTRSAAALLSKQSHMGVPPTPAG